MARKKRINKTDAFEIQFFEGLLRKKPDYVEAIALLADLYTKVGRYSDGLSLDERLYKVDPENPIILYNLACSYALLDKIDLAFRSIKKAIKCGYDDFEYLENDRDLETLRKDRRFQKYYSTIDKDVSLNQQS